MTEETEAFLTTVKNHISTAYLGGAAVSDDQDLVMSGLLDSLAVMRLVAFLEEEFGLEIPARDVTIATLRNPASIAAYVEARRREAS